MKADRYKEALDKLEESLDLRTRCRFRLDEALSIHTDAAEACRIQCDMARDILAELRRLTAEAER